MKSYFEESNISWAKDLCYGLKLIEELKSKGGIENFDKIRTISNDLERYLSIEICKRIMRKDLREPLFVLALPKVLEKCLKSIENKITDRLISHIECDLLNFILTSGFCSTVSIKGVGEALQRIKHLENRLSVVQSKDLLNEVGQCLSELHGVRLSISSFQFEKIEERFEQIDVRLKDLERDVFQQIFASFHGYMEEFAQFNNNFDMSFLLEHIVHPATRRWLVDIVGKWMSTEKQLLVIAGKQGTGKSAICSALANLVPHYCLAIHKVKEGDSLPNSIILSFSQQLALGLSEFRKNCERRSPSGNWRTDFELLLKEPLQRSFGHSKQPKIVVVIDSPESADKGKWPELKEFIKKFVDELPPCLGLVLTVRSRYSSEFVPNFKDEMDILRLHDKLFLPKHLNDVEIYIAAVVGALLAGEHERETPSHACSDEMTVQKTVDELLKMSAGRFDYAKEMMTALVSEMQRTGQFLSSVKKASTPLRRREDLQMRLTDFASPFRSYRDHNRHDPANMNQPIQLLQKSRVALVRRLFDN
ncbi:DgyrCDS10835 [Dimorphilus gyrociliatus]|uniref:DgyrCDS10835 n=1 Tax=Dimorphilus gyrociliatus TaxID=2664684 RepID=A0A7I8W412_9ANNE|nr:DgyrCDS10835 [Dimorphilus gyrociliatus]